MSTILLTGGLGYIGSHICLELYQDHDLIIVDNLSNSTIKTLKLLQNVCNNKIKFYQIDICNEDKLKEVFQDNNIDSVIHLASLKSVNDSISNSLSYYHNNIIGMINLLRVMNEYNCKKILFSSSASIYGTEPSPVNENSIIGSNLTNPYAQSKYMIEIILRDLCVSDCEWSIVNLRFFNPIGANKLGLFGDHSGTNIIPSMTRAIINKIPFTIYGKDYDTRDGTCIRDYIHIIDLAEVHKIVLSKLNTNGLHIYNVGNNTGTTVTELIQTYMEVNDIHIDIVYTNRRDGDVPIVYACCDKLFDEFNWKPKNTLKDMCIDSWNYIIQNLL